MTELNLITLFDKPIDVQLLLDANDKHKKNIGKLCEMFDITVKFFWKNNSISSESSQNEIYNGWKSNSGID